MEIAAVVTKSMATSRRGPPAGYRAAQQSTTVPLGKISFPASPPVQSVSVYLNFSIAVRLALVGATGWWPYRSVLTVSSYTT
jgi:hypothetical protein